MNEREPVDGKNRFVLVVDDDPDMCHSLTRMLDMHGYDVAIAYSGKEALCAVKKKGVDLILLDHMMPGMTGIETLESIRSIPNRKDTPVIMLTSATQKETVYDAIRLGANDFVKKPFDIEILLGKIDRWTQCTISFDFPKLSEKQLKTLDIILIGLKGAFDSVEAGWELPYERICEVAFHIVEAVEDSSIGGIIGTLQNHDHILYAHSVRMSAYLTRFAMDLMHLGSDEVHQFTIGGLLHDAGKAKLPTDILHKRGIVNKSDLKLLRSHVDLTLKILKNTKGVSETVMKIAAEHHERMDGAGYPAGLAANSISMQGRMAVIVENFVAMTDHYGYHTPIKANHALELIHDMKFSCDPHLLDAFSETVRKRGLEPVNEAAL